MEINELEALLKNTKYESFIGQTIPVELKGFKYNDLFKIGSNETGYYALKIRRADNRHVLDSIENMSTMNDKGDFLNRTVDVIEKNGRIILVSDWLDGTQPIDIAREHLPAFFSALANFNKENTANGSFTSMYAD